MNPERWQQIDDLLDAALDHAPAARAAFLRESCPDDEELRGEVESLLIAHGQSGDFIEAPALDIAVRLFAEDEDAPAEDKDTLAAGEIIGRYEVESLLGAGGMGEVYLARDTALDRPVALKLLPAKLAGERDRLHRFEREARTVSKLNHPNILTIHEIGHTDSLHFIATEFIDGLTLRQRVKAGRMKVDEILDIAIQTASALSAAHEAGIVHRDIKPENIMIRRDGYVKVLDFGIAKFTSHKHPAAGSEAATKRLFKTQAGIVMGTVNYMSPEQSRGQTLDAGTDIWSLGVVLYEMCAARVPFDGATPSDVLVAILDREPPALSRVASYVPAELERIVSKALRKDRAERFGNVGEMALEMESLRRQLKLQPEHERPAAALDQPTALLPAAPTEAETVTRLIPAAHESSPPSQPDHPRGGKRALLLVPVVVLLLLAAGIFALRKWQPAAPATTPPAVAATATSERALNYSLLVQKYRDDKPYQQPFKLGGEINFERDYRVRLYVSSPQEGYLYILNERPPAAEGAGASFNVMFPSPNANGGEARLTPNQEIQIPGQGWFQFDEEEGTELIWLVWAAESQPELEALKRFVNPEDRGMITDAGQARAVGEFLRTHSASQPSVEKDEARRETSVRAKGGILTHVVRLQHH